MDASTVDGSLSEEKTHSFVDFYNHVLQTIGGKDFDLHSKVSSKQFWIRIILNEFLS